MTGSRRQVSLPEDLCATLEQKFGHKFPNFEALLEFALRELARDDAARLDLQEQRLIEQRLRELGYL
jgi:hypothetical protein